MTDLAVLDATAQAALVRDGIATPRELVDAALARIDAVNPQLDAVIHRRDDRARREADAVLPDGQLETARPWVDRRPPVHA